MYKLKSKGLKLSYKEGAETIYYIFKGIKASRYETCVEFKDYFEIGCFSSYMRIDKKTMEVTSNLKDVYKFEKTDVKAEIVNL